MADGDDAAEGLDHELAELERIVRKLELPDTQLDDALVLFEQGVARLRSARARLASAELRIQQVLENASGDLDISDLDL